MNSGLEKFPAEEIKKRDVFDEAEEKLGSSEFKKKILLKAEELKKQILSVNESLRLQPSYTQEELEKVEEYKKLFSAKETGREKRSHYLSELLELSKTVASSDLLGERFMVVRSCEYDDYANGVDELILDTKTGIVVGALDATTAKDRTKKIERLAKRNHTGDAKSKYGIELREKIAMKSIERFPLFLIYIRGNEVIKLADAIEKGDKAFLNKIGLELKKSLLNQVEFYSNIAGTDIKNKMQSFGGAIKEEIDIWEK